MESWADFLRNATQQVIDTRLQVYQAEKSPKSIDPSSGIEYRDGQPLGSIANVSPTVLIVGGAAALLVLVFLLKD